ncbi:isopeptide-forming domain-containing fimbrial protein [Clostridium perfringens]|nr:isopeptide-forming domain-containing fimbrial protein [Clostridium perfringens]
MRNNILKKLSILMSFMFIFIATSIPVFAATPSISKDAPTTGSITITKNGATFTAYEILSATQSGDAYEYSPTSEFKGFFNNPKYGSYDQDKIQKLSGEQVREFAVDLHKYVLDNNISGQDLSNGQKNTVNLGYYLVSETSSDSEGAAVASAPILVSVPQVSGDSWNYDITINPKDNTPILEKNIIENDQRVKTSSANIGDVVKYEVNASIPVYQSNAKNIMYKFTDTMSKGLTYDEKTGFKVTSGDKVFSAGQDYTVTSEKQSDGSTIITINFKYDNIKAYADTGLTLNYQATLNGDAVVNTGANDGNPNNIQLDYTNNPNVEGSYKKLTDKVITYTWGFAITKVDANDNNKLLKDAKFSIKDSNRNVLASYTYNENGQVVPLTGNVVTNSNGVATFTGLKEGIYYITEEVAPAGYSLLKDPVEVTITANEENGNYNGAATIAVSNNNTAGKKINDISEEDGNVLFNVQIKNYSGIALPSTGGIGNTGFIKIAIVLLSVVCVLAVLGLGYTKLENSKKSKN